VAAPRHGGPSFLLVLRVTSARLVRRLMFDRRDRKFMNWKIPLKSMPGGKIGLPAITMVLDRLQSNSQLPAPGGYETKRSAGLLRRRTVGWIEGWSCNKGLFPTWSKPRRNAEVEKPLVCQQHARFVTPDQGHRQTMVMVRQSNAHALDAAGSSRTSAPMRNLRGVAKNYDACRHSPTWHVAFRHLPLSFRVYPIRR
jgi:hypothetical protein